MIRSFQSPGDASTRLMLWVDGVGAFLICLGSRVTVGGPRHNGESADVCLLANLATRHTTLIRDREGYLIDAHSPVRVSARPVDDTTLLTDGCHIELGNNVRLRFRLPSVLSTTAMLDFLSDHRPAQNVDGVVLMDDTCLLGPGPENHVQCPDWNGTVVLFVKDGQFHCKSPTEVFIGGDAASSSCSSFAPGEVVSGPDFRFRIEPLND